MEHVILDFCYYPIRKYQGHRLMLHFNIDSFVVEQINYARKIINAYIFYDVDSWPRINNFALTSSLFGATNIVKNRYKYIYMCMLGME